MPTLFILNPHRQWELQPTKQSKAAPQDDWRSDAWKHGFRCDMWQSACAECCTSRIVAARWIQLVADTTKDQAFVVGVYYTLAARDPVRFVTLVVIFIITPAID